MCIHYFHSNVSHFEYSMNPTIFCCLFFVLCFVCHSFSINSFGINDLKFGNRWRTISKDIDFDITRSFSAFQINDILYTGIQAFTLSNLKYFPEYYIYLFSQFYSILNFVWKFSLFIFVWVFRSQSSSLQLHHRIEKNFIVRNNSQSM